MRRQSARFKTEEHEATEEMLASNGGKIPVSPICDNVVHESETAFSLVDKEAPTIEAVQANEKANNKRFVHVCLLCASTCFQYFFILLTVAL